MIVHSFPNSPPFEELLYKKENLFKSLINFVNFRHELLLLILLTYISAIGFIYFYNTSLNLAYNDAMSHLNIARRVFDNLQPGLAQLGSVWLPLPHILMLPSIWSYFFWQTGLSGAIISMISYVVTGFFVFKIVKEMTKSALIGYFCAFLVALNINYIYIQTTALTEPLFMAFFTSSIYFFHRWIHSLKPLDLILVGLSTLFMTMTRYDAWFVFGFLIVGVFTISLFKTNFKKAEGMVILYSTLGGIGILFWILYNLIIFSDPLYFALGEFSAKTQQGLIYKAGELITKGSLIQSIKTYYYAIVDNIGIFLFIFTVIGIIYFYIKEKSSSHKIFGLVLLTLVIFNILSLYFGFSVIFLPEVSGGDSWFNARYGLVILPVAAIFIGYLLGTRGTIFYILIPVLVIFQTLSFYVSGYAVTITDGTRGSSQKNVRPIGEKLNSFYMQERGLILGSAASHDAIFFSSGIPLNQFIHEGVEKYWQPALANPEKYAEYIVMRTHDDLDSVCKKVCRIRDLTKKYDLVFDGEFADIYKRKN